MPLIIARRIRYTIVLAIPWLCTAAIGLSLLPKSRLLRLSVAIIWIVSFFAYSGADTFSLYTNEKTRHFKDVPHYEDFVYQTGMAPWPDEAILSFHPSQRIYTKTRRYYVSHLYRWGDLVHISYDEDGALIIQNEEILGATLPDLTAAYDAFWVIHNPQRVDLPTMDVYSDWLKQHYQECKRYLELEDSVIDYYVSTELACESRVGVYPFVITYDHGTEIGNIVSESEGDQLRVSIWWNRAQRQMYALSLQVFDQGGSRMEPQVDHVIDDLGLKTYGLNISSLPEGEYLVKLIVYDRETLKSQPGTVVYQKEQFERALEIAQFTVAK